MAVRSNPRRILRAEGLVKSYNHRRVVNGVEIEVKQGEVVGLLGPNGAGKTTTFYMIMGLVLADGGRIFIDEEEIANLPMYKRARQGIGYLPQEPSIFRGMTVEQNIKAILEFSGLTQQQQEVRLKQLLEEMGIKRLAKTMAYNLSGGEKRRVEISRALVTAPDFILLDEPFLGIDPITVADLQGIISELKQKGLGVLITDHNVRDTLQITDRAYIIYEGKILFSGSARELLEDPAARRVYLGENFQM